MMHADTAQDFPSARLRRRRTPSGPAHVGRTRTEQHDGLDEHLDHRDGPSHPEQVGPFPSLAPPFQFQRQGARL